MSYSFLPIAAWHFGIGDPTIVGWVVTVGYLLTALACSRKALARRCDPPFDGTQRAPWSILVIITAVLGLNKQLDFQTLLIQLGRSAAVSEHWYQERRTIQFLFVLALSLLIFFAVLWLFRNYSAFVIQHWELSAGLGLVLCYCLLRAAAIDHVAIRPGLDGIAGRWLWLIELLGVMLMLIGAALGSVLPVPRPLLDRSSKV